MKHIRSRLFTVLLAAVVAGGPILMAFDAEARAGKGSSFGSRGSRTFDNNGAAPMQRSVTPAPQQTAPAQQAAPAQAQPGPAMQQPAAGMAAKKPGMFGSGFGGMLMGGLIGAGLGALIFGGNFLGEGFAGFLGFALQMLLVFFVVRFVIGLIRRKMATPQQQPPRPEPYAYAGQAPQNQPQNQQPMGGLGGGGQGFRVTRVEIPIGQDDLNRFQAVLTEVQTAWSNDDEAALKRLCTPELAGYFAEQLAENRAQGVRNVIGNVVLLKGDLDESWLEDGQEFCTVTMRYSMTDHDEQDGKVVSGNADIPTEATEVWTFTRPKGGEWTLSAIQQAQ